MAARGAAFGRTRSPTVGNTGTPSSRKKPPRDVSERSGTRSVADWVVVERYALHAPPRLIADASLPQAVSNAVVVVAAVTDFERKTRRETAGRVGITGFAVAVAWEVPKQ